MMEGMGQNTPPLLEINFWVIMALSVRIVVRSYE